MLREEPFCRMCLKDGLQVASDVVDHIINLAEGGSDERSNKQGLCHPHHNAKTRDEARQARARSGSRSDT